MKDIEARVFTTAFCKWKDHLGQDQAFRRLLDAKVSTSVAYKLCYGSYNHSVFKHRTKILLEMKKDGF